MFKRSIRNRYRFIRYKDEIDEGQTILLRAIIYDMNPPENPHRTTSFDIVHSVTKEVSIQNASERERTLPCVTYQYFLSVEEYFHLKQLAFTNEEELFFYDPKHPLS